ncbi:hypothetical protein [Amycolatopsis sp. NPDC021455]|uniref:hypothetical protein n=1 Tax=Amycolatopsis sp. NPDC021455 TaxID=3154901 RepID=UPI0033CE28A8
MDKLSDRIGRKKVLIGAAAAMAVAGIPCYALIATGSIGLAIAGACVMAVIFAGQARDGCQERTAGRGRCARPPGCVPTRPGRSGTGDDPADHAIRRGRGGTAGPTRGSGTASHATLTTPAGPTARSPG